MNALDNLGGLVLVPLYYAVSVVLVGWYRLFTDVLGLDAAGGLAWILSIVGLTLAVRTALIPLFVRQIKANRNLQLLQPRIKELQRKHGDDRERLARETMSLYQETGTNPLTSCLPILVQMPIFLALFRLLDQAATHHTARGVLTRTLAARLADARLPGDLPIAATFLEPDGLLGVRLVAALLVLVMTATTFLTQRQLLRRNMPPEALTGPGARQQQMLLYVLPVVFAVGGIAFPIGVLAYWTTSNFWTMGQQLYVIRNNPAPGTPAMLAKQARDLARHRNRRRRIAGDQPDG